MVAYNFKKQFADDVESGKKTQTIRKAGKRKPPKVGSELRLYTGMRTKSCRLLKSPICVAVELIEIRSKNRNVLIGTPSGEAHQFNRLTDSAIERLAEADGFASVDAFFDYFNTPSGEHFTGHLIRWEA